MHVILIPLGSAGDVYPFVALGAALKRRGHRITMITAGYFAQAAHAGGFEFDACVSREQYLELIADPDLWNPLRATGLLVTRCVNPAIPVIYDLVKRHYRPGESAVIAGTLAFGARVAQDELGLPLTTVHLQPIAFRSRYAPAVYPGFGWIRYLPVDWRPALYELIDALADRLYAGPLNAFRAERGLPPVTHLFSRWWHSPESTLALFPAWYAAPQPDWPAHVSVCDFPLYDGGNLQAPDPLLESYLEGGDPPLVFTTGTAMTSAQSFFAESAEACSRLGRRAIFVTQFARQVPQPLPRGMLHVQYAPFGTLLPRAAAFVHHGGIGTASQALRAGVPQLVAPCCYDQHDNAARLEALGVSHTIMRRRYRGRVVADALERLTTDARIRERGAAIAGRFGGDPLAGAVAALEHYWNERRGLPTPHLENRAALGCG